MGASASGIIFRREASALLILLWWAATASRCGMSDKALALTLFLYNDWMPMREPGGRKTQCYEENYSFVDALRGRHRSDGAVWVLWPQRKVATSE